MVFEMLVKYCNEQLMYNIIRHLREKMSGKIVQFNRFKPNHRMDGRSAKGAK